MPANASTAADVSGVSPAAALAKQTDGGLLRVTDSAGVVMLVDCVLEGGSARRGGAIHASRGRATLSQCAVTACSAALGGAMMAQEVRVCL